MSAVIPPPQRWDIFCQVIDNFGDIGVCWRLAADLGSRGHHVRLWIDDASALQWMAPHGADHVQIVDWHAAVPADGPGDVVIEAFGCEPPAAFVAAIAQVQSPSATQRKIAWINLEYLSAESYVARCHRLPSLIMSGPGAGLTRWFFYPGFTPDTGGLLREPDLRDRQATFDRNAWRAEQGVAPDALVISLFCYEPEAFTQVFEDSRAFDAHWLVTPGRAAATVRKALQPSPLDRVRFLPARTQREFDEMLWSCDLNFVRGEDSLVRALWAGEAFVWQIYPQDDNAHHAKLEAFLDWMQAPASLRHMHAVWNGLESDLPAGQQKPIANKDLIAEWRACAQSARTRLLAQQDLLTQLLGFVAEKS